MNISLCLACGAPPTPVLASLRKDTDFRYSFLFDAIEEYPALFHFLLLVPLVVVCV
jgi:hypothetical protein